MRLQGHQKDTLSFEKKMKKSRQLERNYISIYLSYQNKCMLEENRK